MPTATIAAPVPFLKTTLKTLLKFEQTLEAYNDGCLTDGEVANMLSGELEGITLLVSGLSTALLDAGVDVDA